MWTWNPAGFNGVPHSGLNMDGWVGFDNTVDVGDYFNVQNNASLGASCVIAGDRSLFCGATNAECKALCYADTNGTGYGNNWRQKVVTKAYTYNAGNQITLDYDYHNECDPDFYFTDVILQIYDSVAGKWVDYEGVARYRGLVGGHETIDIDSYLASRTPPVQFRIMFAFYSGEYDSDEDGGNPTACGAFLLDNYSLTGNVTDSESFETVPVSALPPGWQRIPGCSYPEEPVGDYAQAAYVGDLPIGLSEDPCVTAVPGLCQIADSVIIMCDPDTVPYPHPLFQDNWIISPIIDLSAHPGLAGKILQLDRFARLPLNECVFIYWMARYKPGCASGGWSEWLTDNYWYYSREGASCATLAFDVSPYVPPSARQVQVAIAVYNYAYVDIDGCESPTNNITPYLDNATFATYGTGVTPYIGMRYYDYWQDQFAEDGTLNATSTADTRTAYYLSNLVPPMFGDTLVCRGNADNMEVWFLFRMAKVGPYQAQTHPFFTTWFPGVAGGGWYEARMDTAEYTNAAGTGTVPYPGVWMCAFHEQDPVAVANALPEGKEILANNLFVPGTRIEYYLKTCYSGSPDTFYLPSPEASEEFEILPMYRSDGHGSIEWPCFIVADHFGGTGNSGERNSDCIVRHLAANGVECDVFSKLGPAADLRNGIGRWAANPGQIGGPGTDKYNWGPGATVEQMEAYTRCMLNTGNVYGYSIYQQDRDLLNTWLTTYSDSLNPKFLWVSGDQVCRELNRRTGWGKTFLNNTLCVTYVSSPYANYTGDYAYCLPMNGIAGGRIVCGDPEAYILRTGVCPRSYYGASVIGVSSASGCGAVAEIEYHASYGGAVDIAAVSNVPPGKYYRTFTEGYDNCLIKTNASQGPLACGPDSFMTTWYGCVLSWSGQFASTCRAADIAVGGYPGFAPTFVTWLGQGFPNPMNPVSTIRYTLGVSGRATLKIFDVAGRVVRTLVDAEQKARSAPYEVAWDGKNDRGEAAASGVFFYQLEAPGYRSAKKIVILR
jgi:hypothetical protein